MSRRPQALVQDWEDLVTLCAGLAVEPHDIAAQLDGRGRYELPLDEEFAFGNKLFHYTSHQHTRGPTWHERLELFVPRSLRLKALFDHVREHYAKRLTVADAAAMVGMSQPQFMKTFKRVAGMTLVAYLNHVRLANGSRLLRETGLTIAEIASGVGFSDQTYFDKRFKRAFGRTPREFRRGLRGQDPPGR